MALSNLVDAIAYYRAAESACADYDNNVHSSGVAAFEAALACVPHHRTAATFVNMNKERCSLSTDSAASIATARRVLQDVKGGHIFGREIDGENVEYLATIRELVIAADKREIEVERLRADHHLEATGRECDRLGDEAAAAFDRALNEPAGDIAELLVKAELIDEADDWGRAGDHLLADIRRLRDMSRLAAKMEA